METLQEQVWKRALPAAHHVALCHRYHLRKFLGSVRGRREQYFAMVHNFHATLKGAPCGSSDALLIKVIASALAEDRTFQAHVTKHGGVDEACDPERWRRVLESGAGAVLGEYLSTNGNLE